MLSVKPKEAGRRFHGRTLDEVPADSFSREIKLYLSDSKIACYWLRKRATTSKTVK